MTERDYGPHALPVRYPDPDVIILDPPTFSRSPGGRTFHVENDFEKLLVDSLELTERNSHVLVSTNCSTLREHALEVMARYGLKAARRAGISVVFIQMTVFTLCSALAAVGGIIEASYTFSASTQVSPFLLLNAIAAAVIGGCSLRGGEGSVFGILIGCGIIRVIRNGINLFKFNYLAKGVKQDAQDARCDQRAPPRTLRVLMPSLAFFRQEGTSEAREQRTKSRVIFAKN